MRVKVEGESEEKRKNNIRPMQQTTRLSATVRVLVDASIRADPTIFFGLPGVETVDRWVFAQVLLQLRRCALACANDTAVENDKLRSQIDMLRKEISRLSS